MIRRILLTLAAAALTMVGAAPAALADTTYTACDGVWVIVDYGSLGGVSTGCAKTDYGTGTKALRDAGLPPTLDNGFLEKINGKPSAPDRQTAYWSYWQATRQSDGSYSAWKYATTGANSSHPVKGNAEGWHYVTVSGGATPPAAKPAKNPAATPTPTSTPGAPKSTSSPSAKPSSKASTKPTSASSSSSTPKPNSSSADPQTSSASPSPSGAATSPPASSPTEAPSADPPGMDVPAGSPIAVIATTSALAVGAAGAGGWWLLKGRRR